MCAILEIIVSRYFNSDFLFSNSRCSNFIIFVNVMISLRISFVTIDTFTKEIMELCPLVFV